MICRKLAAGRSSSLAGSERKSKSRQKQNSLPHMKTKSWHSSKNKATKNAIITTQSRRRGGVFPIFMPIAAIKAITPPQTSLNKKPKKGKLTKEEEEYN
ncbi:MAG: hypothetical protein HRT36_07245 [Alphaproteobacteria bacterium]|nr:hypothetical protein [Alphaproteobacteria bacterium]